MIVAADTHGRTPKHYLGWVWSLGEVVPQHIIHIGAKVEYQGQSTHFGLAMIASHGS